MKNTRNGISKLNIRTKIQLISNMQDLLKYKKQDNRYWINRYLERVLGFTEALLYTEKINRDTWDKITKVAIDIACR